MDIHVVQPGETISSIAQIYGVPEARLIQDNELTNQNDLVPGQTIVILYPKQTYNVQAGDTIESIANANSVTVMQLLRNNPFLSKREYIYPGESLVISYDTTGQTSTLGYAYPFINKDTLRKTLPYLTYLTIFNYQVTDERIISFYDDSEIIEIAKAYQTIPLVMMTTLTERGDINIEITYKLLLDNAFQDKQLINLRKILKEKDYMGVNIVFYFMNTSNQALYQSFLQKVSDDLSKDGYLVFSTINPNINTNDGEVSFEKLNYSAISDKVSMMNFMQFIWGTNHGPPAPVSSIHSLKTFTDYAITVVPPDKFIIGMPILAYDWIIPYTMANPTAISLTLNSAINLANDMGVEIQFDELSQTPYFQYEQSGIVSPIKHIVWTIDARTFDGLINLVSEYKLVGTGIWNIMVYAPQLWLIVNSHYSIIKLLPEI